MFDSQTLRTRLIDSGLARVTSELVESAQPCITIQTTVVPDNDIPTGASKFGGSPDVPQDFDWPIWNESPLSFLGQINLSAIVRNPIAKALPGEGLLSFFYDPEQSTWGFDPKDRGSWLVRLFPQDNLSRRRVPDSIPEHASYKSCELSFGDALTLPGWETATVQSLQLTEREQDSYFDVSDSEDADGHHLLGHPQEVQGAMQLECQLASNGIYCGDADGYNDAKARQLESGAADWTLLLQIDSDDNPAWMWGDCGRLYFWITKQDLASHCFDRVWMVLQCS